MHLSNSFISFILLLLVVFFVNIFMSLYKVEIVFPRPGQRIKPAQVTPPVQSFLLPWINANQAGLT